MNTIKPETIDLTEEELTNPEENNKHQSKEEIERMEKDKLYEEFDKIQYEAEIRKAFPPLEEQMAKLDPALQVELIEMEHLYQEQLKTAREIRQNILDTTGDLYEANIMCGKMSRNAVDTRTNKVKELRLLWGNFFYHNIV